jgi:hypothetical protein
MKINLASLRHSGHAGRVPEAGAWNGKPVRSVLPAIGLFLVAPLVAEFLLGNMSITHLGLLGILAPLYGGGALLIRECVRRTGRGWTSIFLLALAYGVLEEAFLTESLFNPDYLGLKLHLLQPAFVPAFGIGAWYTLFVLTLHTVWSISAPIALIETLVPKRAQLPWIGRVGIGVVAVVFAFACISMGAFTVRADPSHFAASRAQFTWSAFILIGLIALAFSLPRRPAAQRIGRAPNPWIPGIESFALASIFLLIPSEWGWWAVLVYLSLDALAILPIWIWSCRTGWSAIHRLALAGGAAIAYGCHAFVQTPSLGNTGAITRVGNLLFAVLAAILVAAGARKASDFQ